MVPVDAIRCTGIVGGDVGVEVVGSAQRPIGWPMPSTVKPLRTGVAVEVQVEQAVVARLLVEAWNRQPDERSIDRVQDELVTAGRASCRS